MESLSDISGVKTRFLITIRPGKGGLPRVLNRSSLIFWRHSSRTIISHRSAISTYHFQTGGHLENMSGFGKNIITVSVLVHQASIKHQFYKHLVANLRCALGRWDPVSDRNGHFIGKVLSYRLLGGRYNNIQQQM